MHVYNRNPFLTLIRSTTVVNIVDYVVWVDILKQQIGIYISYITIITEQ